MRKVWASWVLGGALLAALSVAAAACDYSKTTASSADSSQQTAQAQPASSHD